MPEEQLPEEVVPEENEDVKSSNPYVEQFLASLDPTYFVTIHKVKTIRWGGLLYLLHCVGYPEFQTELIEYKTKAPEAIYPSPGAPFIVRFQSKLRLYPSKAYADYMGWTAEDVKAMSQMTQVFQGSATIQNLGNSGAIQFSYERAETRANCRSARACLGIGMCSSEEMSADGDTDEVTSESYKPVPKPNAGLVKGFANRCAVQSDTNPESVADISGDSREADLKAINSLKGIVPDGISIVASFMSYHKVMVIDQLKDSELKELRSKLTINP